MGHYKRQTIVEHDFVPAEYATDRRRSRLIVDEKDLNRRSRSADIYGSGSSGSNRRPRSEMMMAPVPYYPAEYPPERAPRRMVDEDDYQYGNDDDLPRRRRHQSSSRYGEAADYYRQEEPPRRDLSRHHHHHHHHHGDGGRGHYDDNNRESRRSSPSTSNSERSASSQRGPRKNNKNGMGPTVVAKGPWNYRGNPDARAERKKFEKECPGFDWSEGLGLALTAIATVVGVDKILEHADKKMDEER